MVTGNFRTCVHSAYVRYPLTPRRAYHMAMPLPLTYTEWTADMLDLLPNDGNRYEIVDGELFVTPAPAIIHQRASVELVLLLAPYGKSIGIDVYTAPTDVEFAPRRVVQPDVLALPRTADGRHAERFADVGVLLLAVEVLSPYSKTRDLFLKRELYQQERVPDYWIVDCDERVFIHWTPERQKPEIIRDILRWQPMAAHPPLIIDVMQYFRDVLLTD